MNGPLSFEQYACFWTSPLTQYCSHYCQMVVIQRSFKLLKWLFEGFLLFQVLLYFKVASYRLFGVCSSASKNRSSESVSLPLELFRDSGRSRSKRPRSPGPFKDDILMFLDDFMFTIHFKDICLVWKNVLQKYEKLRSCKNWVTLHCLHKLF